jgi:hypothetical protein
MSTFTKSNSRATAATRGKSRRGRNPSIDISMIENAVREIGSDREDISMKVERQQMNL